MEKREIEIRKSVINNEEGITLLHPMVFWWNKTVSYLDQKFTKLGYKQVYTNNLYSFVEGVDELSTGYYSLSYTRDNVEFVSYGKYSNEIEEARNITIDILEIYNLLGKELFAVPFLLGKLPLEQDKNILTTYCGSRFIEASYLGKKDGEYYSYSKISYDIIHTLIGIHSDENGLIMPPKIADTQIVIVPLKQNEKGVLKTCRSLYEQLISKGFRVLLDDSSKLTTKEKKESYIKSGIPLIIELGPRDVERNVIEIIIRDNLDKIELENDSNLSMMIDNLLNKMHKRMYNRILINNIKNEKVIFNKDDLTNYENKICKVSWCGEEECLKGYKDKLSFISFNQQNKQDKCLFCSRKSKYIISMKN